MSDVPMCMIIQDGHDSQYISYFVGSFLTQSALVLCTTCLYTMLELQVEEWSPSFQVERRRLPQETEETKGAHGGAKKL